MSGETDRSDSVKRVDGLEEEVQPDATVVEYGEQQEGQVLHGEGHNEANDNDALGEDKIVDPRTGVLKGKKHDKRNHQLALARESAARNRAAKESGQLQEAAVKELTLPYRAVRRIMKLDKEIGTVQVEAAIVATKAAELFVQKLAKESHKHAKDRGRSGIKYEDLAETRAMNDNLAFLDTLLP
jgi:histone H3/H4